jgi:hypothetical protein
MTTTSSISGSGSYATKSIMLREQRCFLYDGCYDEPYYVQRVARAAVVSVRWVLRRALLRPTSCTSRWLRGFVFVDQQLRGLPFGTLLTQCASRPWPMNTMNHIYPPSLYATRKALRAGELLSERPLLHKHVGSSLCKIGCIYSHENIAEHDRPVSRMRVHSSSCSLRRRLQAPPKDTPSQNATRPCLEFPDHRTLPSGVSC